MGVRVAEITGKCSLGTRGVYGVGCRGLGVQIMGLSGGGVRRSRGCG